MSLMRRVARHASGSAKAIGRGGNLKRTKSSDDALADIMGGTANKIIFTITYSSTNSDGGMQEYNTAVDCVRAIFPGCEIIENKLDDDQNNVELEIAAEVLLDDDDEHETIPEVVWSGLQQNLFRTNPDLRHETVQDIKGKLKEFLSEMVEE